MRRRLQEDAVRAVDDVHGRVERATQIFEPRILGAEAVQRHAVRLLDLLDEDSATVFKMVGPVLMKNDVDDAKQTVDKRLEYITGEL